MSELKEGTRKKKSATQQSVLYSIRKYILDHRMIIVQLNLKHHEFSRVIILEKKNVKLN